MKMLRIVITAWLFALPLLALAQDDESVDCGYQWTNRDILVCANRNYLTIKADLDKVFKKLVDSAGEHATILKQAQKDWEKVIESQCYYAYGLLDAAEAPIEENDCLKSMTQRRTLEITKIIEVKNSHSTTVKPEEINIYVNSEYARPYMDVRKNWENFIKSSCEFYSKFINENYNICSERLNILALSYTPSSYREYLKVDATLNEVYKKFMAILGENSLKFKQAQLAWIRLKEKHCDLLNFLNDQNKITPEYQETDINECLLSMTKKRTEEIIRTIKMSHPLSLPEDIKKLVSEFSENGAEMPYQKNTYEAIQKYWDSYFKASCEFSAKYVREDYSLCIERISKPLLQSPEAGFSRPSLPSERLYENKTLPESQEAEFCAQQPLGKCFAWESWAMRCDNTRTCCAVGFPGENDKQLPISAQITRAADPSQGVVVRLRTNAEALQHRLSINDSDFGTLPAPDSDGAITLNETQTRELLTALSIESKILVTDSKNQSRRLSNNGAAEVLLKMDEVQGYLDTPEAFIRKGNGVSVSQALPPPQIRIPPLVPTRKEDAFIATDPQLLVDLRLKGACKLLNIPLTITRLTQDKLLVSALCFKNSDNEFMGFWVINAKKPYQPLLVTSEGSGYADGQIYHLSKSSYRNEIKPVCWLKEEWSWNGKNFVQSKITGTRLCGGVVATWVFPSFVTDVIRLENKEK